MSAGLSSVIGQLSARELRAAIEEAAASSPAAREAIEKAVRLKLSEQCERRARRAEVSEALSADMTVSASSNSTLTPLYSVIFDEDEGGAANPDGPAAADKGERNQQTGGKGRAGAWEYEYPKSESSSSEDSSASYEKNGRREDRRNAPRHPTPAEQPPRQPRVGLPGSALSPARTDSSRTSSASRPGAGSSSLGVSASAPQGRDHALGHRWLSGFIFYCRHDTKEENFSRGVFGLAKHKLDLLSQIDPETTALFLFDSTFRKLHGVYAAASEPGLDLDPDYLKAKHRPSANVQARERESDSTHSSPFPAQVRFRRVFEFAPLDERRCCHLLSYNRETNVFRHRIDAAKVSELLRCLDQPSTAPTAEKLPWELNGYKPPNVGDASRYYQQNNPNRGRR